MKKNMRRIGIRHFAVLESLGEMSEKEELPLALVRYAVRKCLISMEATGAAPTEVFAVYFELARQSLDDMEPKGQHVRRVIESAVDYADHMLRVEYGEKH